MALHYVSVRGEFDFLVGITRAQFSRTAAICVHQAFSRDAYRARGLAQAILARVQPLYVGSIPHELLTFAKFGLCLVTERKNERRGF